MASENQIEIVLSLVNKIQGDLDKAKSQIQGFASQTTSKFTEMGNNVVSTNKKIISSTNEMLRAFGIAFGAAQFAKFTKDVFSLGLEFEKTSRVYKNLSESRGLDPDLLLGGLENAFEGTVAKIDIQKLALKQLSTGLRLTQEDFEQLASTAKAFGDVSGNDTTVVFEAISNSIGKLNPKMLQSIGLFISQKEAAEAMSGSIGKAEKQTSLFNLVMARAGKLVQDAGGNFDSTADNAERLAASFKNFKTALGEFGTSDFSVAVLENATDVFNNLTEGVNQFGSEANAASNPSKSLQDNMKELSVLAKDLGVSLPKSFKFPDVNFLDTATQRAKLFFEAVQTGKDVQELYNDKLRDFVTLTKQVKEAKDKASENFGTETSGLSDAEVDKLKKKLERLQDASRGFLDLAKHEQLDDKIKEINKNYDKQREILEAIGASESEINKMELERTRALRDQKEEILGMKKATESLESLMNSAFSKLAEKNPRRSLQESTANRLLGNLPGQDFRTERFLQSGALPGEGLSIKERGERAGAIEKLTPRFDANQLTKSLQPIKPPEGGEQVKIGQQEDKSAKEKLKLLESIKKKMEQNDNKEKEAYRKIEQTIEKMTENEDKIIDKMDKLFSIAGDHEGRIQALEAKP